MRQVIDLAILRYSKMVVVRKEAEGKSVNSLKGDAYL